jgi:hypothetical protein
MGGYVCMEILDNSLIVSRVYALSTVRFADADEKKKREQLFWEEIGRRS